MKTHITDIDGLTEEITEEFDFVKASCGVFSKWPDKLDNLLQKVISHIRICIEYYDDTPPVSKITAPPPCNHKWRDIKYWYMKYEANRQTFQYKICKPYVCIYCKKRKDELLQNGIEPITKERGVEQIKREFYEKYSALKLRAIVEDEVNDMINVDREYLRMVDILHGDAPVDHAITLK